MAAPCAEVLTRAGEPTVSVLILRELASVLEKKGVSRARFFEAARLDPHVLDLVERRLPRDFVFACCEVAMDMSGDPALGLHWSELVQSHSFDLMSHLLTHAATLRQAFDALFRFGQLMTDQLTLELVEREDDVELRGGYAATESLRARRLAAEMSMLGFCRMLRAYSSSADIRRVNFDYPAPSYHAEYARLFNVPVSFDQPFTSLVFDRALMDCPLPHRDEDLKSALRAVAELRVSRIRRRMTYTSRVRKLLLEQPAPHRVAMRTVASLLGVSERSLTRRLSDEGQSYARIASEAAATAAKRLLADDNHSIQEVASAMGFADASSFHRAFKRWTGTTPTKFRA